MLTALVFAVTTIVVAGPALGAPVPQAAELAATTTAAPTSSGAVTTAGTDFWVTIPPNFADGFTYDLFVSGAAATSGTVTDPGRPPVRFSITPGHVTSLTVTGVIPSATVDGVVDEGIHVVAGSPVTIYGLNLAHYSSDAFTSLPTVALGTRYRVASYAAGYAPSRLSVLATAAGTTVTVTPSVTVGARTMDVPYTVSLAEGQVYTLATTTGDLSGSLVTSNHPVAVWGSVDCGSVDVGGNSGSCDIMMQELPPTSSWGSDFLAVRYLKASFGDPYRIFADTDNTTVTVDGTLVGTIARAGGYLDGVYGVPGTGVDPNLDVGVHIQTSHPAMIIQYQTGGSYTEGATTVSGDPSMMLVPPTQQYLASYTIATPPTQFVVNDVNVTVPTADIASLRLNGRPVSSSAFVPIVGTTFSGAQLPLPLGSSTLTDTLPFGAFVYGENDFNSYAYPGGYSVASIANVSSLVATSPVRATAGSQVCIPVTVEDSSHHPLAGIRVDAAVGGANPTSTFAVSGPDGVASVCFPATRAGTDTVSLSVGSIETTVTVNVEALSSAVVPSAPRHVHGRAGDGHVTLTFMAPASDGGAEITGYQMSVDRGPWRTTSTPVRITGLRDGRTYEFRVRAVNGVGSGPTSTVAATPKSWIVDPVSARSRRAEVGIPTDPEAYRGPLTNTTATDRSYYGTIAVPMNSLHGRPLRPLDAAVLSGPGLFAFNSAVLTAAGRRQVAAVAASLRGVGAATCEGYTDYGGEALHELQLSTARANAVCQALIRDGARVRTEARGYGEAHPVVIGGTAAQRAGNRRVVISFGR